MSNNQTAKMKKIFFPFTVDETGEGFFWPDSASKRREYHEAIRTSPHIARAVYNCDPVSSEEAIFRKEDFIYFVPPKDLELGLASLSVKSWLNIMNGEIIQAWDTGFSALQTSDATVCITALAVRCGEYHAGEDPLLIGECEQHLDVYILDVSSYKIDLSSVISEIKSQASKWLPSHILVENKAYGAPALEALSRSGLPLIPVNPLLSKKDRVTAVIGAGSVQGSFRQRRVRFAENQDWLDDFESELIDFRGERGGKDDKVDALGHLISWALANSSAGIMVANNYKIEEEFNAENPTISQFNSLADVNKLDLLNSMGIYLCGSCRHFDNSCKRFNKFVNTDTIGCTEHE